MRVVLAEKPSVARELASFLRASARREGYFEGLAEFAVAGRPSDEELAAFYLRHDNVWL